MFQSTKARHSKTSLPQLLTKHLENFEVTPTTIATTSYTPQIKPPISHINHTIKILIIKIVEENDIHIIHISTKKNMIMSVYLSCQAVNKIELY